MHWRDGIGGWGYLMVALNMILFWGLLITAVVLLVRFLAGGRRPSGPPTGGWDRGSDPQRVLAERYARGEIDDEEYQRRLNVLRESGGATPG